MARTFRYYGKKRGHRRTGSPLLASAGETLFSAAMLLLGCCGLALLFVTLVIPEWRVNREFVETTCKVRDKQIREKKSENGIQYVPEFEVELAGGRVARTNYDIHKAYSGKREETQAILDRFKDDDKTRYSCWYDPTDPSVVVLTRGYRWWLWLPFTVPISFIIIGAGGLLHAMLHWGKSAERRAATTFLAGERELLFAAGNHYFPTVPRGADMTNSPGTKLNYRLPMAGSPGWALFGILAFCVVWNGVVAVFVVIAVGGFLAGKPDWFLTLLLLPFLLIGIGAIAVLVRQLVLTTRIGPTLLEISAHPLHPGGKYRVVLSQSGWLTIQNLQVSLVCEEIATYHQGTNTRTETREVRRVELWSRKSINIRGGEPLEVEIELSVPADAMHSLAVASNEVKWSLAVEGDAAGWSGYERAYPVIIQPAGGVS